MDKNKISAGALIILSAVIIFTSYVRLRLLSVPLERDEGEYAYAGQLINQGIPPYEKAYNMKMPGVYFAYAAIFRVFGATVKGIHAGVMLMNILSMIMLFFVTRRLYGESGAVISSCCFGLLSIGLWSQSISANAEHFVMFFVLAGMLVLLYAMEKSPAGNRAWACLVSGILFGTAFLMKQHAVAFILFALVYIVVNNYFYENKGIMPVLMNSFLFSLGALAPFLLVCLFLYKSGVFDKFWFWTFTYAGKYVTGVTLAEGIKTFKFTFSGLFGSSVLIWIFAFTGLAGAFLKMKSGVKNIFPVVFGVFSFIAVCPGLYFRQHYYIFLFPAVAILFSRGVEISGDLAKKQGRALTVFLAALSLFSYVYAQRNFFFGADPDKASRMLFGVNPFVEAGSVSKYVNENTSRNDTVAVLGSEPEIYFLSGRLSATGYIYTYPLVEKHNLAAKMQEEMINEIEANKPEIIVFVNYTVSWLPRQGSPSLIFDWAANYIKTNYTQAAAVNGQGNDWIGIFRKKK